MSWVRDFEHENMHCDGGCGRIIYSERSRLSTVAVAREQSWTVVEGATIGGGHMSLHLCLECSRIPRPPKVNRLEGEIPLFE